MSWIGNDFACMQVAQFTAEFGQYPEAIGIYEDVARRCVDNNLLKYSAKGYLLNAGICHLCGKMFPLASPNGFKTTEQAGHSQ